MDTWLVVSLTLIFVLVRENIQKDWLTVTERDRRQTGSERNRKTDRQTENASVQFPSFLSSRPGEEATRIPEIPPPFGTRRPFDPPPHREECLDHHSLRRRRQPL